VANINRVVIQGNLTRDPELRQLASGNSICKLRVAVNTRIKDRDSGQWTDKPNYFDVTVWGGQGESCARYLTKGSGIMVDGRLDWREWETPEGQKRQAVEIIAENTHFVGGRGEGGGFDRPAQEDFTPVGARGPQAVPAADDDDIPF